VRNVIRSRWSQSVLLFALALLVAQCGNESDVVIDQELHCLGQDFPGGGYMFTVDSVSNDCGLDAFIDELVGPGDQFSVVLPAAQQLPTTTDITFDPPIGTVTVDISLQEDRIRVTTPNPITRLVPGFGNVTGTVSGILCPVEGGDIVSSFNIGATALNVTCNISVAATGT
jgi:hypothetical protein